MNEVSDMVYFGQYELAMKRITIANVNRLNRHDESFLIIYAKSMKDRDMPEFVEHMCTVGYELKDDDFKALACCLGYNRHASAKLLLSLRPDWFSDETFDYMRRNGFSVGMCYFIERGFPFKWYKPSSYCTHDNHTTLGIVSVFYFARERARERALILLWLPPSAGGRVGITKDVARIIARVVWELRKFN